MLNHCYLCSQTNQITDYSSLVLTLNLSSIFAKVSQFHTFQSACVYFPEWDKTWSNTGVKRTREYMRERSSTFKEYQLARARISDVQTILRVCV